jgi:hypothetical protein
MFKIIRRILIALVLLTIVAVIALYVYSHDRTFFNNEDETGNTAGNIYNGGLYCERDGKIYFSNDSADGALFVMNPDLTGMKQIRDDKAVYINADENYLYYVRANNTRENDQGGFLVFYNTGVFRVNHKGENLIAYTGNPAAYLTLKGNYVYFQRYDVEIGLYLYRYMIDGTEERLLIKDAVIPTDVKNNTLYYAGLSEDHNINAMNLSSFTKHPVLEGSYMYPIFMGEYIYYIDPSDNYKIYRMNQDGSEPTLLVDKRTSTYNITNSGKYLYYQVDGTKKNGIHRLSLETMKDELLMSGDFKQINATSTYVFFKDFMDTTTYAISADGVSTINEFTGMEAVEE